MLTHFETPWLMITGGDVVLPGGDVLEDGTVLINQGMVQAVLEKPPASLLLGETEVSIVDATGQWVTPGLIDQHMHGAFGIDFNHADIPDIQHLLRQLPHHGVTGILPTLISAPRLDMVMTLSRLEEVFRLQESDEARILGLHLEGPFLSREYRGAHPTEDLLLPTEDNLAGLISPSVKRVTLAPELEQACPTISRLAAEGILCSIGHSGADYPTTMQAIEAGASCATHLFNAMGRLDHRNPGIAITSLLQDDFYVELICDGKHVSPIFLQLVFQLKPFERCIVISDCNALTGLPVGTELYFGRQKVTLSLQGAVNEDGRLAGGAMLVTDCIRNLVQWQLLSFPHAVQLATLHPAQYLQEATGYGQVIPGALGDIVLWDKTTLAVTSVILGGVVLESPVDSPTLA